MKLRVSATFVLSVLVSGLISYSQIPLTNAVLPDIDGDGVPDDLDNCPNDPNPLQEDIDSDGIGDACQTGDQDGDGIPNNVDNCPKVANPLQEDTDGDGIGDACQIVDDDGDGVDDAIDNCPNDPNSNQQDTDGDGIGDACQPGDSDGDGIPNNVDNCPNIANPLQEDTDSDTVGDVCEDLNNDGDLNNDDTDGDGLPNYRDNDDDNDGFLTTFEDSDGNRDFNNDDADSDGIPNWLDATFNPPPSDSDGDGRDDLTDNCPINTNPLQEDVDGDGIGDACDSFPFDPQNDAEGDGVGTNEDNCPFDFNPDQSDSDLDGIGDACETRPTVSILDVLVTDPSLVEGDLGATIFIFSVVLNQPAPFPATVQFFTADITALAGEDYATSAGFVNFGTGEMLKQISIPVNGDGLVEPDEVFSVSLFNPIGVDIINGRAIGPIRNDDNSPVANGQSVSVIEDNPVPITLTATDADLDVLTFTIITPPAHGDLSGTAPNLTYTPHLNFNGDDFFTFRASDGVNDSNEATVNITITAINDPPIADAGIDQSVVEGTLVTLSGSGSDVDDDALTFSWAQTTGTLVTLSDTSVTSPTFTAPLVGPAGEALTFTLTLSDSNGGTATDTATIHVDNMNLIPPEAYNQFDPISKDVLVFGTDDVDGNLGPITPTLVIPSRWNDEDHRTNAELRTYVITDSAENKLTLTELVKIKGKEVKAKVISIQYNDDPKIIPPKNKKSFEWSLNKDSSIKELEQKMEVGKGDTKQKVTAKFDSKKNQTKIESQKPKLKEKLSGLILLKLNTSNGNLVISR